MFVPIDQVKVGVANFVEREIATKATGLQKFLSYCAVPLVGRTIDGYAAQFSQNPVMALFFNDNKEVNIDELYNMAKSAVRKSGQFTVYGIILGETDIDRIYNYIKQATA